ncbi:site-specific recombinase XerD [Ruminiclostridium sufflavum DSM 19573]|uniref:Site-specific recombinase XerD n=1 Tax=Ruminiclostridium sufflavum DSM 19573 TaxID=1121337 RepID=A0A318XJF1_9FIRM|nr:tyrosine-type recombinase/integrase [Ruminiclostridium sufflavum]PYG84969.1 site-specific recombinase XerD [Ruminiclostridium sufflavum DSM 19573]
MKAVKDSKLFNLICEYFTEYLPKQRKCSPNTIRAYQNALELLLDFIKMQKNIRITDITFNMLDRNTVSAFLEWIESERGASVATQNQRLAAIHAFFSFVADAEPYLVAKADEIGRIKATKCEKKSNVKYLSEAAIKAILAEPSGKSEKELRDRFLMIMLYDTGARIQEILDIRLCNLQLTGTPTVTLHGKGNKTRKVALMEGTVKHLKRYLNVFHSQTDMYSEQYLFYVKRNDGNKRMTEDNARRLIRDYGVSAKENCPEVPDNVHPHLFRHSRAMHLYQHGMPLALISQWLGHSEVETTLIYAHADTEMKRKAIEAATPKDSPLKEFVNADRFTMNDEDLIKRLYGLK